MVNSSGELLDKTRMAVSKIEGLEFAALFGSLVTRGETGHDIDVAVKVSGEGKYSSLCRIVESLSKALGVEEERIDLVDIDRASLELKKEVLVDGIVLLDNMNYRRRLLAELNAKYIEYDELQSINIREWVDSKDPSSIDLRVVKGRIDFAKGEVQFLKENVLGHSPEDVMSSPILRRLMERGYHLIIEAMLDVCRHIASVMGWGPALSYPDLVEICFQHNVIAGKLGEDILKGARLRNIIIHRYLEVDYRKLYEESGELGEVVGEFERQVLDFVRRT